MPNCIKMSCTTWKHGQQWYLSLCQNKLWLSWCELRNPSVNSSGDLGLRNASLSWAGFLAIGHVDEIHVLKAPLFLEADLSLGGAQVMRKAKGRILQDSSRPPLREHPWSSRWKVGAATVIYSLLQWKMVQFLPSLAENLNTPNLHIYVHLKTSWEAFKCRLGPTGQLKQHWIHRLFLFFLFFWFVCLFAWNCMKDVAIQN